MRITCYRFGHIEIDGHQHERDVLILPDRTIDGWRRKEGHYLSIDDLTAVIEAEPEKLVVGNGYYGRMIVPEQTRAELKARGIELHVADSRTAVTIFNDLQKHCARLAAALHVTC